MSSIRFCTQEMLERFSKIQYITEYLEQKRHEISNWNAERNVDACNATGQERPADHARDASRLETTGRDRRRVTDKRYSLARLLKRQRQEPVRLVTDNLGSYRVAHRDLMPWVTHDTTRYGNNRGEVSHQPTRQRERQMRGFTSSDPRAVFLARSRHHSESVSRGSAPAQIGSSSNVAGTSFHRVGLGDSGLISDQLALVWLGLVNLTVPRRHNDLGDVAWVAFPHAAGPKDGIGRFREGIRRPKVAAAC